ncbi:right-handed parallel beta-helix repeat-containing protein [Thermogutta sp.]|uniref:right-handed parallel beta-helix repeat-containing protein n=1 Tax=Thermogutta sp. TaxID=1962930 RepID=UPI00321F8097
MKTSRLFLAITCLIAAGIVTPIVDNLAAAGEGDGVTAPFSATTITVRNDSEFREAVRRAQPGMVIRIQSGQYKSDVWIENLHGRQDAPIVIEGADPQNPPVFVGGSTGWQISEGSYIILRHLHFRGQKVNGLNIDDGGSFDTPAHHIRLEHIVVEDVGPVGNCDGIKLSGVTDFVVVNCRVEGWGGQAIDMVGCHRGVIERCLFKGKKGFSQDTGPQAKGGSTQIVIRQCRFVDAAKRCVQLGGSTGLAFFRPQGVLYEAKDLLVEDCLFVGGEAAVSFVGVDGAVFRHNTIIRPQVWVARILQETREPGFVPSRNGFFERNLIVFRSDLRDFVNVGPYTAPETFRFAENWWFCEDRPAASRPRLPSPESEGVYGQDPRLRQVDEDRWVVENPAARDFGVRQNP